jgi:hypothetical protein
MRQGPYAALGSDAVALAETLAGVAAIHRDQRRFRAAEAEYRQALRLLDAAVDERHPTRVALRADYADLLCELGRDCEAAELASDT